MKGIIFFASLKQQTFILMQELPNDKKWRQASSVTPRYESRKVTQNDKQLSPWNNQDYKKVFQPQQYYETITVQSKRRKLRYQGSKSLSLGEHPSLFGNKISKDFMQLVKLQKKGAYMHDEKRNQEHQLKMNLVSVNLDENLMQYQENRHGQTLDNFYNVRQSHNENGQKEQPVRVRLFKKILEKNKGPQQQEKPEFTQAYRIQMHLPQLKPQGNPLYQAMPRRTPRLSHQRKKIYSTMQTTKVQFFPQLAMEKNKSSPEKTIEPDSGLYCRGEIIGKKDSHSKRRMKFRQFQIQDSRRNNHQNILFLHQF